MHVSKTKIALALTASLMACSAMADIKIAVMGPYTNSTSYDYGQGVKGGIELAAAEINAKGGILGGQKISLIAYDEMSNADKGAELAKQAVSQDRVVAGLGLVNTGVVLKTVPVFQKAGVPFIITSSTGGTTGNMFMNEPLNYIFRLAPTDAAKSSFLVKQAYDIAKHKKIAVFADSSPYGQSGLDFIIKALKERNSSPIIVERFPVGEVNMEEAAFRAREAGAEAIITWTLGSEAAAVKTSINRIGWRVPMYGSWTLTSKSFADNAGPISTGAMTSVTVTYDSLNPVTKKFVNNYKVMHRQSTLPSLMAAAQSYDSTYLLAMAINQAGSTDSAKIVAALENLNGTFEGAVTTYQKPWSKENHELTKMSEQLQLGIMRQGKIYKSQ